MAVCEICKKSIGLFEPSEILVSSENSRRLSPVCKDCFHLIKDVRNGKEERYEEYFSVLRNASMQVKIFLGKEKDLPEDVDGIKKQLEDNKLEEERREEERKRKILVNLHKNENEKMMENENLVTTGLEFSGYNIESYCGIVSGDIVIGTGFLSELDASLADFSGSVSSGFSSKMNKAKMVAIQELKQNALNVGANGIIGVEIAVSMMGKNMIGVSATGTGVRLTKIQK